MIGRILGKGLVVSVILLFIGVAVQPSIAINPVSSDNEEDCDICPKVSNLHIVRLKSLINRFEKYDNLLSVLSKHNPEFEKKYQVLSNRLSTLKELNKEIKSYYPYPIICNILLIIYGIGCIIRDIWNEFLPNNLILSLLFLPIFIVCGYSALVSVAIYFGIFKCGEWPLLLN